MLIFTIIDFVSHFVLLTDVSLGFYCFASILVNLMSMQAILVKQKVDTVEEGPI